VRRELRDVFTQVATRFGGLERVGFVNSVGADFQGNPEPAGRPLDGEVANAGGSPNEGALLAVSVVGRAGRKVPAYDPEAIASAVGCVTSVAPDFQGDSAFAADALGPQVRRLRRGPATKARLLKCRTPQAGPSGGSEPGQLTRARTPPSARFPYRVRALGGLCSFASQNFAHARGLTPSASLRDFPCKSAVTEFTHPTGLRRAARARAAAPSPARTA
jgi:hypothetical protein